MNIDTHIKELQKDGLTILKNVLTVKDCEKFVKKSNNIWQPRLLFYESK